jgi:predicted ATPase/DNA-binding CsgD family transcriptional regulator
MVRARSLEGEFVPKRESASVVRRDREGVSATTGTRARHGLPAELTSFIGRRRELGDVKRLLGESRLVTLTGSGGVGKTRLAQQVAAQARRLYADGVRFVDLTAVHDPALLAEDVQDPEVLAHLVAMDLGLREQPTRSPLELLTDHLAPRSMLVVLDNCEHLIPACAVLADALLRSCPELRILATTREPLDIAGEALFPVPPLPVPASGAALAELAGCESVALFVARGRTALPDFQLTADNHGAVAGVCRHVEGLPLALELAASWLPVLAPQQILDRLADRFRMLRRGVRSAPGRQQTLRACIDWSHELCSKPERLLWARMSVFVGGCELDAIESVCIDEDEPEAELLEVVAGLVDKSILIGEDAGTTTRYRMLETLRDYGRQKLVDSGEYDALRRRHRDWYQDLVHRAGAAWANAREGTWLNPLRREHANVRAAVEYCLAEPREAEAALDIMVAMPWVYWYDRGLFAEGRRWLDVALTQAPAPTPLRTQALLLASKVAFYMGDFEGGRLLLEEGEELALRLDAPDALVQAAYGRSIALLLSGNVPGAVEMLERGLATLERVPQYDVEMHARLLLTLSTCAELVGDHERAVVCCEEVMAIAESRDAAFWRAGATWLRAFLAWRQGNIDDAITNLRTCLRLGEASGFENRFGTANALESLAWVSADQRRYPRAATLLGAADALFTHFGTPLTSLPHLIAFHNHCVEDAKTALGDAAFEVAFTTGCNLSYDAARAYALEKSAAAEVPTSPAARTDATPLTRREREVADLVCQGLTNKEIAARLVISPRTAETHVEKILSKLGFTSRSQIAAWVAAQP